MRLNIRKSIITGISLATLLPAFSLLQSCDDSEAEKWVDLRYRVEDSYLVEATHSTLKVTTGPEKDSF